MMRGHDFTQLLASETAESAGHAIARNSGLHERAAEAMQGEDA
jgi:hypothetical protein